MTPELALNTLKSTKEYFDRSTRCLEEKHSTFAPADGMYTAAQQIGHVAIVVDWFVKGASRPEGFDMNFEQHEIDVRKVKTIKEARAMLDQSFKAAEKFAKSLSAAEIAKPLPDGPIMAGMPRFAIFPAIDEHTAHHRGALTVYSRMLGLTPAMPYMEMEPAPAKV
jgi:uncharacterized damage-inducible protein DinB